jgi:AcrR family transcriptional regulator
VNKKETIVTEAKRLFGHYGYLGFTLKQLAQACDMTAPALYYFYSSKADLFRDCLLSELEDRHALILNSIAQATSLATFARSFAEDALTICETRQFRVGTAMQEVIHLPAEQQAHLHEAYETLLVAPLEAYLARTLPGAIPGVSTHLLGHMVINLATFTAAQIAQTPREELTALITLVITNLEHAAVTA